MTKRLYPFQSENVAIALGDTSHIAIVQPTGSGKTVMMVAIAGALIAEGHTVLIGAPQEHIEDGFTRRDYKRITRRGEPPIAVPPESMQAARDTSTGIVETVRDYLSLSSPGYALVCTHSALTRFRPPTGVPNPLSGSVLIIDEAHHAAALGLSQFVEAWVQAGGRVIFCTATDFRSDDSPVVLPGMRVIRRTLSRHMQSGYAPRNFRSAIHAVRLPGRIGLQEFYGNDVPAAEFQREIVRRMVVSWRNDDKPKTIVRVPVLAGGSSEMVGRVVTAFRRAGARVLDVSGSEPADKARFLSQLIAERAATNYNESQWDIIVGVQRVIEGMDWKWCAAVYCVGLPQSVHTTTQLIGRAARKKRVSEGYPEEWVDYMHAEFFVPCADTDTFENTPAYHARKVLLVCAYLNNIETARDWRIVQTLSEGISVPLGDGTRPPDEHIEEHYPYVDDAFRQVVRAGIDDAVVALPRDGIVPDHGNVYSWVLRYRPAVPRAVLAQVLAEDIQQSEGSSLDEAKRQLFAAIDANLSEGRPLRTAIIRAFLSITDQLQEAAVVPELEEHTHLIRRQVLELTGRDMEYWATVLGQHRPLTAEWLTQVCRHHHAETGRFPSARMRGGPTGWPDESWAEINEAIRERRRDWSMEAIHGLNQFCDVYMTHAEAGTVGEVVGVAARTQGLLAQPDMRHLLDSFLSREVVFNGNETPVPLRDLPAFPGRQQRSGYPDVMQLLNFWYLAILERVEEPITLANAWLMCERLEAWFRDNRGHEMGTMPTRSCADYTRVWSGTELVFTVRGAADRRQDLRTWLYSRVTDQRPVLMQGQHCYCQLLRCPFSSGRGATDEVLVYRGGQSITQSLETVPVRLHLAGAAPDLHPLTTEEFETAEAFQAYVRAHELQSIDLLVPLSWFHECLYTESDGHAPIDVLHRINPLDVINRLPVVIDANIAQ